MAESMPDPFDYPLMQELFVEMGRFYTEGMQVSSELANVYQERIAQNTDLYITMSKLTNCEFCPTYASLRRDPNPQERHKLAQDHKDRDNSYDGDRGKASDCSVETKKKERAGDCMYDSPCSCERFSERSAHTDETDEKLDQSLASHNTATISVTDEATAKLPKSLPEI
ncbi:uncharacterized protein N7496_005189 [Penicillium cataractarum]|uniref:Uncharacterized protein n=1 Tax=Penicillium cataractarum TaxID=2100454 RepID=A0A9W9SG61_9EURO|nr:uncharacterized protein N7496_005189 [Penicillium cataractarum]KAJ5377780.1 hypothetical protein N7496_005189 [Penicillium cataractarum]